MIRMEPPRILRPWRLPLAPGAGAVVCAWLALTPSLLPRTSVIQALLCGVAALLGYGMGAFGWWVLRNSGLQISETERNRIRRILVVAAPVGSVIMLGLWHWWQQSQRAEIAMENAPAWGALVVAVVAPVVFLLLVTLARSLRAVGRRLGKQLDRILPRQVAAALAVVLVAWGSIWAVQNLAVSRIGATLDTAFLTVNDDFLEDVDPPTMAEVSGSPESAVTWESLGRQGRAFVSNTSSAADISTFHAQIAAGSTAERTESPVALQPIRVYVGGGSGGEVKLAQQAEVAVTELERTGAFDRAVINVVTGTGRGWVNEHQVRALEFMWNGDTATVSMQYSYLPSWMSFLVDAHRAQEAGRYLFEAVYAHWASLDPADRPLLVVSGESLGSFGSEGAFSSLQDLTSRTDGALYVGPTANNELWQQLIQERDPGTPAHAPIHDAGATVRFSADGQTWAGGAEWNSPRVGYLQHANDPVTWFDFGVFTRSPDWVSDDKGPGVPDAMVWIPVITALQLAIDQLAAGVPEGQGHEFGLAPISAWAHVLAPPDWTEADTEALKVTLAELRTTDIDSSSSS